MVLAVLLLFPYSLFYMSFELARGLVFWLKTGKLPQDKDDSCTT